MKYNKIRSLYQERSDENFLAKYYANERKEMRNHSRSKYSNQSRTIESVNLSVNLANEMITVILSV